MLLSDRMCIIPVKYFRRYIWSVSDSEYVTDFTIGLKCAISILEEWLISDSVCADVFYESYTYSVKAEFNILFMLWLEICKYYSFQLLILIIISWNYGHILIILK